MRITVLGLGLIGGSLALDLRAADFVEEVIGVDTSPEHAELALQLGLVDRVDSDVGRAMREAEVLILAIPVGAIREVLPKILDELSPPSIVLDLGSTKAEICASVVAHPKRRQFLACHPMAGTEHSGPHAAMSGLFSGKAVVLCDAERSGEVALQIGEKIFAHLGMRIVRMGAEAHDLHAAFISHLSHVTSFVLANTVLGLEKDVKTIFDLASGGFESTVRLAKSSPEMWTPIFDQNRRPVLQAIDAYLEKLRAFRHALATEDSPAVHAQIVEAGRIRPVLEKIQAKNPPSGTQP